MTQTEKRDHLAADTEDRKHRKIHLKSEQVAHAELSAIPLSDLKFFLSKITSKAYWGFKKQKPMVHLA